MNKQAFGLLLLAIAGFIFWRQRQKGDQSVQESAPQLSVQQKRDLEAEAARRNILTNSEIPLRERIQRALTGQFQA